MSTTTITPGIVGTVLWAKSNAAHNNHLHVEPPSRISGEPPLTNPGMTAGLLKIVAELERVFGPTAYMKEPDGGWSNMGYYNRRYIAGTTTWSQHAYANAIDIGPYYGIEQQQKFYDFLIGKEVEIGKPDNPGDDVPFYPIEQAQAATRPSDVAYIARKMNEAYGLALPIDGTWGDEMSAAVRAYLNADRGTYLTGNDGAELDRDLIKALVVPGPKGDKGDKGDTGSRGPKGDPAPIPTSLIPKYD